MLGREGFTKVDVRVGHIDAVEDFQEARDPSYKLRIDFGRDGGARRSSESSGGVMLLRPDARGGTGGRIT